VKPDDGCCGRCGTSSREVHHSTLLGSDVCLRCFLRGTDLIDRVGEVLIDVPRRRADVARAIHRRPSDRSVSRALRRLAAAGLAVQSGDGWRRAITPPGASDLPRNARPPDARSRAGRA
jgi:hypothetical protein